MSRFRVVLTGACVVLAVSVAVAFAGDEEGGGKERMKEIKQELRELHKQEREIHKRLHEDPEVAEAHQAMIEAQKTYRAILAAKLAADPDGAEVREQQQALKDEMAELRGQGKKKDRDAGDAGEMTGME